MTAHRRVLAALGAALVAALALSACGESLPANVIAQVASKQITKQELEHWVRAIVAQETHVPAREAPIPVPPEYTACIANLHVAEQSERETAEKHGETPKAEPTLAESKTQCARRLTNDRQQALGVLLQNIWLSTEAQHIGANVSNAELHKEFEALKREGFGTDEAAFRRYLARDGYTVADVTMKTRDELLKKSITDKVLKEAEDKPISKQEIASYYHKYHKRGETPEIKGVDILLTQTAAQAAAAKSEIQSGRSFKTVAKRVSIYRTSGTGGYYLEAVRAHETEALAEEIWHLKPNVLTGPFHTDQGYFVLELKKTTPASSETLPQAERSIQEVLRGKLVEHVGKNYPEEFAARWRARTTCRAGYVTNQCKEFKPHVS